MARKRTFAFTVVALLTACATTDTDEGDRADAVRDFIEVSELGETDVIRTFDQLDQEVLNDYFVIVSTRKERYLLEYAYRCSEDPFTGTVRPDVRRDARAIYAGADTFRGCRIKALYLISAEQADELQQLGKAPGE